MPGVGIGVYPGYNPGLNEGEEVSSTYEGRHITVLEQNLIHPNHLAAGLNLVQKGDPVIICNTVALGGSANYGRAVGVAFNTATAITDLVAVDTEGIWLLPASSYTDGAVGSAIVAGDPLYIHDESLAAAGALGLGDALISKIRNLVTQVPFGYALGTMVQAGTGTIAIKVHWDPRQPQDEIALFQAGHAADNAMSITVIDTSALAAGNHRALHINYGNTVNMVGGIRGLGVDVISTGNAASMNAVSLYTGGLGTANIPEISGLNVYMDDIGAGATCAQKFCINLNNDNGDGAVIGGFIRVYSHAPNLDCVIYLGNNGANQIDNLLFFSAGVEPYSAGTLTDSAAGDILCDSRIRCLIAATPMWIPLYNTAP